MYVKYLQSQVNTVGKVDVRNTTICLLSTPPPLKQPLLIPNSSCFFLIFLTLLFIDFHFLALSTDISIESEKLAHAPSQTTTKLACIYSFS